MSFLFFTGAGVSISAGIPDFRSDKGIFKMTLSKSKKSVDLFDASQVFHSHESYLDWLAGMASLYDCMGDVKPTHFHRCLVRLHKAGQLQRVYSQNIDELEIKAGLPKGKTTLLHGTLHQVHCMVCGHKEPLKPHHATFKRRACVPCTSCKTLGDNRSQKRSGLRTGKRVGTLRPSVLLYNEGNAPDVTKQMRQDRRKKCTIVIIGTSLKVHGLKKAIQDLSQNATAVWLVNPDKDLTIPSELKQCITRRFDMTADEFATYMDKTVLKQRTMDLFVAPDEQENRETVDVVPSKRLFVYLFQCASRSSEVAHVEVGIGVVGGGMAMPNTLRYLQRSWWRT